MFLDSRSNTCPLAELWNTLGTRCSNYVATDIYNGLYQACVHEANKKNGTCPNGYVKNPHLHVVDEKPLKYLVDPLYLNGFFASKLHDLGVVLPFQGGSTKDSDR